MESVEGETLESLIKRTGRLGIKPALEIATQVAAGLAAVWHCPRLRFCQLNRNSAGSRQGFGFEIPLWKISENTAPAVAELLVGTPRSLLSCSTLRCMALWCGQGLTGLLIVCLRWRSVFDSILANLSG
jgi:hypothetical protein